MAPATVYTKILREGLRALIRAKELAVSGFYLEASAAADISHDQLVTLAGDKSH